MSSSQKGMILVGVLVKALQPAAWAVTDDMQFRCDSQSQIVQVVTDDQLVRRSSGREGGHGSNYIYKNTAC